MIQTRHRSSYGVVMPILNLTLNLTLFETSPWMRRPNKIKITIRIRIKNSRARPEAVNGYDLSCDVLHHVTQNGIIGTFPLWLALRHSPAQLASNEEVVRGGF